MRTRHPHWVEMKQERHENGNLLATINTCSPQKQKQLQYFYILVNSSVLQNKQTSFQVHPVSASPLFDHAAHAIKREIGCLLPLLHELNTNIWHFWLPAVFCWWKLYPCVWRRLMGTPSPHPCYPVVVMPSPRTLGWCIPQKQSQMATPLGS